MSHQAFPQARIPPAYIDKTGSYDTFIGSIGLS